VALRQLLDDTKAWIRYRTYRPDEIAVRFHHRLVQIHPFPNGNGRHARLMADLLVMRLGGERFRGEAPICMQLLGEKGLLNGKTVARR
jgi:fido (protein-threonine AMPylation protein)